jgi:methyl-accepting chemotaxis protein-2 (aspartate sensor receptor)
MTFAFSPLSGRIGRLATDLREAMPKDIGLDATRTIEVVGRPTPVLGNAVGALNLDCSIPDAFTSRTGATATIFVRQDREFVRISTSVKKQNGERALGTTLNHAHPGYARLLAGQSYVGYATLFGTQYLTQYDALSDTTGRVIGALYVGIDVSQEKRLSLAAKVAGLSFVLSSLALFALLWAFAGNVEDSANVSAEALSSQRWNLWLLGCVANGMIAAALYWLIRNAVAGPLTNARNVAQRLASGDLTSQLHVDRNDDIGQLMQAINGIAQGLSDIVGNVRDGATQITSASSEIATGNADLSARTSEQAAALEETAASMTQLIETVRRNAENADHANRLVLASASIAAKGGEVVNQVVRMMSSIKRSSEEISRIVTEIEDIAFQTNILALNAAVEAARAGEHGRSFTVVAGDVRGLAQRSAIAAKEIKTLITESVTQVDEGSTLADHAGKTMSDIVTSVKRVTDIMGEISTASHEQSAGIEQVNVAIAKMDEMTQQNAALVEEAAAAAESLHTQAEKLSSVVGTFKLP